MFHKIKIKFITIFVVIIKINVALSSELPILELPDKWVDRYGKIFYLEFFKYSESKVKEFADEGFDLPPFYDKKKKRDETAEYSCIYPIANGSNLPLCFVMLKESSVSFLNLYESTKGRINVIGLNENGAINADRIKIDNKGIAQEMGKFYIEAYQNNSLGKVNYITIPCEFQGLGLKIVEAKNKAELTMLLSCKKYNNLHFINTYIQFKRPNNSDVYIYYDYYPSHKKFVSFPELAPLDDEHLWFSVSEMLVGEINKHLHFSPTSSKNKSRMPLWIEADNYDSTVETKYIKCPSYMEFTMDNWTIKASSGLGRTTSCRITRLQTISPKGTVKNYATLGKSFSELDEDDYLFEDEDKPAPDLVDIFSLEGQLSNEMGITLPPRFDDSDERYIQKELATLISTNINTIFPRKDGNRCGAYRPIHLSNSFTPDYEEWISEFGCFNPKIPVVRVVSGNGSGSAAIIKGNKGKPWIAGVDHVGIENYEVLYDSVFGIQEKTIKAEPTLLYYSKNKYDPSWYQQVDTKITGLNASRTKPLKQGEKIWMTGYPGGKGPVDLRCIYSHGNSKIGIAYCHYLSVPTKKMNDWQTTVKQQKFLYDRLNVLLKGMSGGPLTDRDTNYLGSLSGGNSLIVARTNINISDVLKKIIFQKHPSLNNKNKQWENNIVAIENIGEEEKLVDGLLNSNMLDSDEFKIYNNQYEKLRLKNLPFCEIFLKVYFDKITDSKRKELYSWLVGNKNACGK